MGSACAIKYCEMIGGYRDHVVGLILDSSFKSFSQLVCEIAYKQSKLPNFLVCAGYHIIKGTLESKGKFKVDELEL